MFVSLVAGHRQGLFRESLAAQLLPLFFRFARVADAATAAALFSCLSHAVSACLVQATVSVIPAASSLILKALNEPERDRKKVRVCVRAVNTQQQQ